MPPLSLIHHRLNTLILLDNMNNKMNSRVSSYSILWLMAEYCVWKAADYKKYSKWLLCFKSNLQTQTLGLILCSQQWHSGCGCRWTWSSERSQLQAAVPNTCRSSRCWILDQVDSPATGFRWNRLSSKVHRVWFPFPTCLCIDRNRTRTWTGLRSPDAWKYILIVSLPI